MDPPYVYIVFCCTILPEPVEIHKKTSQLHLKEASGTPKSLTGSDPLLNSTRTTTTPTKITNTIGKAQWGQTRLENPNNPPPEFEPSKHYKKLNMLLTPYDSSAFKQYCQNYWNTYKNNTIASQRSFWYSQRHSQNPTLPQIQQEKQQQTPLGRPSEDRRSHGIPRNPPFIKNWT